MNKYCSLVWQHKENMQQLQINIDTTTILLDGKKKLFIFNEKF